jgi:AcrR family transcriptional regulator
MGDAELTRSGFYNHFKSKEELFAAAVSTFLTGRGAQWRADAGIEVERLCLMSMGALQEMKKIDRRFSIAPMMDCTTKSA